MLVILERYKGPSAKCLCPQCNTTFHVNYVSDAKKTKVGHLCNTCKYFVINMEITQENLQKAFVYKPETGEFTYRSTSLSGLEGEDATKAHTGGYRKSRVGGKDYLVHRLIYMYVNGVWPDQIDHINHIRDDNRWVNIRNVPHIDNCKNHSQSRNNTSKVTGVALHKPTGKYRAYIGRNYKQIHLGLFDTIEEAQEARKIADQNHDYHPNHGEQGSE